MQPGQMPPPAPSRPHVSLFVTCVVDQVFPEVGIAMADVLEGLGCTTEFRRDQTCCGQPAFNSGFRAEARSVAESFLKRFEGATHIVVRSGSCCSMITHHFADVLEPGDPRVHDLESRVFEFSSFLVDVLGVEDVGAKLDGVATYHDSCHALRELKIKDPPRRLLSHVRGLELREMDAAEEGCGFGGDFSGKIAPVFGGIARPKIGTISPTRAVV